MAFPISLLRPWPHFQVALACHALQHRRKHGSFRPPHPTPVVYPPCDTSSLCYVSKNRFKSGLGRSDTGLKRNTALHTYKNRLLSKEISHNLNYLCHSQPINLLVQCFHFPVRLYRQAIFSLSAECVVPIRKGSVTTRSSRRRSGSVSALH